MFTPRTSIPQRVWILPVVAMMVAALTLPMVNASEAASPPRKILTGWIPYYGMKTALPSAVANGDLIKEVMPFWYTLKNATNITDLYTPANPSVPMSTPLATMRDSGFTIIPTITDGTSKLVLAQLLAKPETRTQVVTTIVNLVMANNFDGIDLDFEGFAFVDGTATWNGTRPGWVAFVQELSIALHAQEKLLSITTPVLFDPASGKKGYYVYDWATIAPMIDRLRIMTYDYSTASPGSIGPLAWVELTVQYAVTVIPASKIYIGVAGYGRDWVTKVVGICPALYSKTISTKAKAATFLMRNAPALIASYGAKASYSEVTAEVSFTYDKVYSGATSTGLDTSCTASRKGSYQDARSYAARAKLVEKYRLGGITAWTFGMEDVAATDAVRLVAQAMAPDLVMSTISVDQSGTLFGNPVIIKGEFHLPDSQPVAGLSVKLEALTPGTTTWREILTTVTDSDGSILTPLILSTSSSLRLSSEGSWERLASLSAEQPIALSRRLAVSVPTSVLANKSFTVSGTIQPHQSGISLELEKKIKGTWVQTGLSLLSDDAGRFTFSLTENSRGLSSYRVLVGGDDKFQGAQSSIFTVVIR